jgi:hypothetical protein
MSSPPTERSADTHTLIVRHEFLDAAHPMEPVVAGVGLGL